MVRLTTVLLAALLVPHAVSAQSTREVLGRASRYVVAYEAQLPAIVADEHYEQHSTSGDWSTDVRSRVLDAQFAWLHLPRVGETIGVRAVTAIDGVPTGANDRLRALLEDPPDDATEEIRAILAESARHSLGPDQRNFNFPTFVLVYLRPARAPSLSWRSSRRDRLTELRFTEPTRGTVVRSAADRPVRARGRFLVDAATGRVERAEIALEEVAVRSGPRTALTCELTVTFSEDAKLGLWVPSLMEEDYRRSDRNERLAIRGRATYTNFRRYVATGRLVR